MSLKILLKNIQTSSGDKRIYRFSDIKRKTTIVINKVLSQKSISSFPRASQKEKEWELYEEVKEFHQKVREQINSQKENVFTTPAEELQREAAVIYPLLEEYMALTKRFAEIYFLCKKKKNVYDFVI